MSARAALDLFSGYLPICYGLALLLLLLTPLALAQLRRSEDAS